MNDAITAKNYKKLSLQIAANGMSFAGFDTLNREVTTQGQVSFSKTTPLEDELWKVFVQHPELKLQYDEVVVLHDNNFNSFVPNALLDENYPGSYLQYNTRVFEADFFAWDTLGRYDITNVYVPLMNVNNFLIERLGAFEYKNTNSILVEKLLDASINIDEKQVFVHVQDSHFEIVVVKSQKLLLYNSFEYSSAEDFLYYLLFTLEQLLLNPETVTVWLLGKVSQNSPIFTLAYTYIRNVALYNPAALAQKWHLDTQDDALHNFILFNT
ncbi:DUF3822 family protein [Flavobacterium subsaxonicum]|uniref:DUF3822 domain-containing protein n=1 Tax=Flavobacterium subsaxonicum WB 4.1-42 = DSM 21790 TaxID=1121898 RepID=A0A0A2MQZ8_9FLAO|nr:DUF3822 family protein [Flavobacterium subsaxonicum]KGO94749.1 hypothetical protein Q766_01145 [Flavobacterium subsaxonicum WB 4.1-42 = DSM 21790]